MHEILLTIGKVKHYYDILIWFTWFLYERKRNWFKIFIIFINNNKKKIFNNCLFCTTKKVIKSNIYRHKKYTVCFIIILQVRKLSQICYTSPNLITSEYTPFPRLAQDNEILIKKNIIPFQKNLQHSWLFATTITLRNVTYLGLCGSNF